MTIPPQLSVLVIFDPRFLTVFKSNMNAGNQNFAIDK